MSVDDDYIVTATGRKFYFYGHEPGDICLEDIAIALSRLCRFTGHCRRFYSVGEHSLHAAAFIEQDGESQEGFRRLRLATLLHDAPEAYIGDASGPLKHLACMDGYRRLEATIAYSISIRFGLTVSFEDQRIKTTDMRMRFTEKRDLMPPTDVKWKGEEQYDPFQLNLVTPSQVYATPHQVAEEFLKKARWYGAL